MRVATLKQDFQPRLILSLLSIMIGVMLLLRITPMASYLFVALAMAALLRNQVLFVFFILILVASLNVVNNVFFEKNFHFYLAQRGTLFAIGLMLILKNMGMSLSNKRIVQPFRWLVVYTVVLMVTSLAGWQPVVSVLKGVLFLIFILAFIQGSASVIQAPVDVRFIRAAVLSICCFYIIGSAAVIPFPAIGRSMLLNRIGDGHLEDHGLFNGVTWHSQTLGPLLALLNAYILSDYLFNMRVKHLLHRGLLFAVPVLIFYTSSRTGMLAYVLSMAVTSVYFLNARRVSAGKKNKYVTTLIMGGILLAGAVLMNPRLLLRAESYLRKGGTRADAQSVDRSYSLGEDLTRSRMALVQQGWRNFKQSPIFGNGFQVSEHMQYYRFEKMADYMSAPVEKGFLPTMILEEGGIVGTVLFLGFLCNLFATYLKLGFNCFLSVFTTLLLINSGEALFFSTSALGGVCWMIAFCALLMDVHRMRFDQAEQAAARMAMFAPAPPRG